MSALTGATHLGYRRAAADARAARRVRDPGAARVVAELMALPPAVRCPLVNESSPREQRQLFTAAEIELGTPYAIWRDAPVEFITDVLGESLWSIPRRIAASIPDHKRIAVPSCFGSSKTWSIGRIALWWGMVHPVGVGKVVTIAPQWRQVVRQLWPEIRGAHARAGLPGRVDTYQWVQRDRGGLDVVTAYGLAAPPHNETAVQGIHGAALLVVVDEAGGISRLIGRAMRGMLTGKHTRSVLIGNPPTSDEGSWFESQCDSDDVLTIPISAYATPNLTGEATAPCHSCPPEMELHPLADHLVDEAWVRETIAEVGEDSPYVQAKVYARFPRGGGDRAIPGDWVAEAAEQDEPDCADGFDPAEWVRLDRTGLEAETDPWLVRRGAWIRLGVDVAADGGDELAIARAVGDLVTVRHTSAGAGNANAVTVAGRVLTEIRHAQALRDALGTTAKVRVKVDGIGVGWGVASILQAWAAEGVHDAEVVVVIVSERAGNPKDGATLRPANKRAEMWLAMRSAVQPQRDAAPAFRLRVDRRTMLQLSSPKLDYNSRGEVLIESKEHMSARGVASPDRAEGVLLAVYEPPAPRPKIQLLT